MGARWTDGEKQAVKAWLLEKRSSGYIAKALGRPRPGVIAAIHRYPELKAIGLSGPNPFANPEMRAECSARALETRRAKAETRAKAKAEKSAFRKTSRSISASSGNRRKAMRGGIISKNRLKPLPKPAIVKAIPVAPTTAGVSLMDLGPRQCRFCINETEPKQGGHLFCGETTEPGQSWCAWHEQIVFSKRADEEIQEAA